MLFEKDLPKSSEMKIFKIRKLGSFKNSNTILLISKDFKYNEEFQIMSFCLDFTLIKMKNEIIIDFT